MRKYLDQSKGNQNGIEPFFPANFNPSRRADFPFTRKEQVVF